MWVVENNTDKYTHVRTKTIPGLCHIRQSSRNRCEDKIHLKDFDIDLKENKSIQEQNT